MSNLDRTSGNGIQYGKGDLGRWVAQEDCKNFVAEGFWEWSEETFTNNGTAILPLRKEDGLLRSFPVLFLQRFMLQN